MIKLLETLKDSAESTFDSAVHHVENAHRLVSGYVSGKASRFSPRRQQKSATEQASDSTIYDVVRGVNREIGEFGTDMFEIVEDARARQTVDQTDVNKGDPKD